MILGTDSEWITTLIQLVLSIFIFFLGIPALVFQTFIPEDLRKIFNKYVGKRNLTIIFSIFILVLTLFTYYSSYILGITPPPDKNDEGFPIVSFVLFILFFGLCFIGSMMIYFSDQNIYKILAKTIVNRIANKIDLEPNSTKLRIEYEEELNDLEFISKLYSAGNRTTILNGAIYGLVLKILHHEKCKYNGNTLEFIIRNILCDSISHDNNAGSERNFREVLSIYKNIINSYSTDFSLVDLRAIKNSVLIMGKIALKNSWKSVAFEVLDILKRIPDSTSHIYSLCKEGFKNEDYYLLVSICNNIYHKIGRNHNSVPEKRLLIALLSWFYASNDETKIFASSVLKNILPAGILKPEDFLQSKDYFNGIAEFITGSKIKILLDQTVLKTEAIP